MNALAYVPLPEQAYDQARENFEQMVGYLDSVEASSMSHSELERELEKKGRELMRLLLQEHLDNRGPGQSKEPVFGADGQERTRQRPQERDLETIFGGVRVERTGYGCPGAQSLHPLDAELNLPDERYSLELRRRAAEEAAKSSYDETVESIAKRTGANIGKRQVEELVQRAACDFDAFYRLREQEAAGDHPGGAILALSVDGKGVTMRAEHLREKTRKAAEARRRKMDKRLSKGEKKNAKRMATVAAVYTIAPFVREPEQIVDESNAALARAPRPRPEAKRVWASLEKEPAEVIKQAFDEARKRDPTAQKTWVALVDGDNNQIRRLRRMARKTGVELTIVCDVVHVIEYLWAAGRAFYPESGPELEGWVRHRLLGILQGKAGLIAGGMRRSATRRALDDKARKPVDKCATYLLNHAPYLHYHLCLVAGMPIATGVIEGACRHLVKDRMEITGARWSLPGAEAVLRLRALRSSGDFDEYWTFHEDCEYRRTHQSRYEGGHVPPTDSSRSSQKSPNLKRVK